MNRHTLLICIISLIFSCVCWNCLGQDNLSRTDNCTGTFKSCGDDKCCCKRKSTPGGFAMCIGFGKQLQYIPSLPKYISDITFNDNYLPYISENVLLNISLYSLSSFTLRNNNITSFSPKAFVAFRGLAELNLSNNNNINQNQLRIALGSCKTVRVLIIDNIGLKSINKNLFNAIKSPHLYGISIRRNPLYVLRSSVFQSLPHLSELFASNCMLYQIFVEEGLSQLRSIDLAENSFKSQPDFCSINTPEHAMRRLEYINLSTNGIRFLFSASWSCLLDLRHLNLAGNKLYTIQKNTFSLFTSLYHLDLGRITTIKTIEDYAFNNSNLHSLIFSANKFKFQNNDLLQGLTNLKIIDISDNYMYQASVVQIFFPMKSLEKIIMKNVRTTELSDSFIRLFPNLTELFAEANLISNIHNSFKSVKRISKLGLGSNRITNIQREDLPENLLKTLTFLDLGENEYDCSCSLRWFRNWVSDTVKQGKIWLRGWPDFYWCRTPHRYHLVQFNPTEESCSSHNYLWTIGPIILGSLFAFVLINIVVYRKRWYIRYWIYKLKKPRQAAFEERHLLESEDQIKYDGYVVYHDEDCEFVHTDLIGFMEKQHSFKLHVWHRDADPGLKLELMFDGIHASRNVICVVSNHFLNDSYCLFQLKVALDRQVERDKKCLFLVLLGDIDYKSLSKYWCAMLTKQPTALWCQEEGDIKRVLFEQNILEFFKD